MSEPGWHPDWTLAPAALLRDWMDEHGVTKGALARWCGRGEADIRALLLVSDVLERKPLREAHAETLEKGTGIPAARWLSAGLLYRNDLAAGRAGTTPEDQDD